MYEIVSLGRVLRTLRTEEAAVAEMELYRPMDSLIRVRKVAA